jgi:hypothetical protein
MKDHHQGCSELEEIMTVLGILLIVLALIAAVFGLIQLVAAKKVLAAPFYKTGNVAANPALSAAEDVSFEGTVQQLAPLFAPASQRPCLYFEVEVQRLWRKWENTENGTIEKKGTASFRKDRAGSVFTVNDGSGAVQVDARSGLEAEAGELAQSFEQVLDASYGDVLVGQYRFNVPPSMNSEEQTYGVRVTERLLEPHGQIFVVGKHNGQSITAPNGALRVSRKSRDALVGGKKKFGIVGLVAAAILAVLGFPLAIFSGPMALGIDDSCSAVFEKNGVPVSACKGNVSSVAGNTFTWNVDKAGSYIVTVTPPAGVKFPIRPTLSLLGPAGEKLDFEGSGPFSTRLKPGAYTITVRDIDLVAGRAKSFKGGFSYALTLKNATSK